MSDTGSNELAIISTGIGLGIVHVLTGPDHLSALATLSASVRDICTCFSLGVRWGIGHSTGLLLVGGILIFRDMTLFDHDDNGNGKDNNADDGEGINDQSPVDVPESLGHICEMFVGFFMLFLGVYGFRRAFDKRRRDLDGRTSIPSLPIIYSSASASSASSHSSSPGNDRDEDDDEIHKDVVGENNDDDYVDQHQFLQIKHTVFKSNNSTSGTKTIVNKRYHDDDTSNVNFVVENTIPTTMATTTTRDNVISTNNHSFGFEISHDDGDDDDDDGSPPTLLFGRHFSTKSMAVFAGIIHGLAGPGGVLGVVPAVQLHDWFLATIYLGTFCITSTLTMGCFATIYGTSTFRLSQKTNLEFHIHCFSSGMSILVGITWLILLSIGKLDDVFP